MLVKNINFICSNHKVSKFSQNLRRYSQAANILTTPKKEEAVEESVEESLYPPVKTKYPPGQWNKISPDSAWKIHESAHKILRAPSAKWRLEKLAGNKDKKLWLLSPLAPRPNNLEFQKIITRSHLIEGLPEAVRETATKLDSGSLVGKSVEVFQRLYEQEFYQLNRNFDEKMNDDFGDINEKEMEAADIQNNIFISRATKTLIGLLKGQKEYLMKGELDENVRVETFWSVGGFEGEEKSGVGAWEDIKTKDGTDAGILTFQYKHLTDLQVRSEQPLPEFVSMDDSVCRYADLVPTPSYAPDAVNIDTMDGRPISIGGQWIGSACEFVPLSVHHLPSSFIYRFNNFGVKHLDQAEKVYMITSMFASCLSQAYNQGFCDLLDLTYPITTQSILTTPSHFRTACYQLNTTSLWNDANPLRNVAWISPQMPIFVNNHSTSLNADDKTSEADRKSINPLFVTSLLQSLLLEPRTRGVNLRPYLPHDPSPLSLASQINNLGDPVPEHYVPGRFEYPKNAVYF